MSVLLQSKHRFDPLPPGWFYNGSHYVSLTGDKDHNHPCILLIKRRIIHVLSVRNSYALENCFLKIDSLKKFVILILRLFLNYSLVLETFIEDHLLSVNEDIKRHNNQTDSKPAVDIFTKPKSSS